MIRAPCAQALPALKWLRGPLPEPENNGVQKSPPQRMALRDGTAACCREPAFGKARAPRWPCARLRGGVSSGRWWGAGWGATGGGPPLLTATRQTSPQLGGSRRRRFVVPHRSVRGWVPSAPRGLGGGPAPRARPWRCPPGRAPLHMAVLPHAAAMRRGRRSRSACRWPPRGRKWTLASGTRPASPSSGLRVTLSHSRPVFRCEEVDPPPGHTARTRSRTVSPSRWVRAGPGADASGAHGCHPGRGRAPSSEEPSQSVIRSRSPGWDPRRWGRR